MIELPEALNLAKQLNSSVCGKMVSNVLPPTKEHKFCWFSDSPEQYQRSISDRCIISAEGFGSYAEIVFEDGHRLCVNDGVNPRFVTVNSIPSDYQLTLCFSDGYALTFTVAMYGGIFLHNGSYDNPYYLKSRSATTPLSENFDRYFYTILSQAKPSLSAKALVATEQRFPGIGNGTLQDILFNARIHPKRKVASLEDNEVKALLKSMKETIADMTALGGRDTEKDLYGNAGGYKTAMSKISIANGCPSCGGEIIKQAYLGGSVYFCPLCQKL